VIKKNKEYLAVSLKKFAILCENHQVKFDFLLTKNIESASKT